MLPQRPGHEAEGALVDLGDAALVDALAEADLAHCQAEPAWRSRDFCMYSYNSPVARVMRR